jgi:DNA-binding NarL/FixJ family response regulator
MAMMPTRFIVADDHPIVRLGLRQLLEAQLNWKVVAEAPDGREAVAQALQLKPDVVVLDIGMPGLNGFEACEQIVCALPSTKVLILSMHETDAVFKRVLASGARGFLLKTDAPRDLVAAVEAVRGNKTYFTAKVSQLVVEGYLNPAQAKKTVCLTPRQVEVVQLIAEGKNSKDIAVTLKISEKTVTSHRTGLMRRLNAHSVPQLVRYAIRNELIRA